MRYTMQTALYDTHDTHDATEDTYDAAMLRCKLTIVPDVLLDPFLPNAFTILPKYCALSHSETYFCIDLT